MVIGCEYIFDSIDQTLDYVLETECRALAEDVYRREPPRVIRPFKKPSLVPTLDEVPFIPVDSLDYPLSAWFNDVREDKFVMTRLFSGRYSLKPNLKHRKCLGERQRFISHVNRIFSATHVSVVTLPNWQRVKK